MGSAVEAAEWPVRIDEADYESDARAVPSSIIDERGEDEGGGLVGGCY